jgi:hypothetical protein
MRCCRGYIGSALPPHQHRDALGVPSGVHTIDTVAMKSEQHSIEEFISWSPLFVVV